MKSKRLLRITMTFLLMFTFVFMIKNTAYAYGNEVVYKDELKATTVKNSSTKIAEKIYLTPYDSWSVIPLEIEDTGLLYFRAETSLANYVPARIFVLSQYESMGQDINEYDIDTYSKISWYYEKPGDTKETTKGIPVTKGQTYYILIRNYAQLEEWESEDYFDMRVDVSAWIYTTQQRDLSQGTKNWTVASGLNKNGETSSTYFKVKPDRTGVMTVSLKEYGYKESKGKVTLYNKDKKKLSNEVEFNTETGKKVKFGVKKGETYYLKITETKGTKSNNYKYGIQYTMSSATDRAIGSKSSAKSIYRKADSATSTLFTAANKNSVDYYKVKVTTARKTKLTLKANDITSGYVTMRLYSSSGKLLKTKQVDARKEGYILTSNKLAKGTYYVKVTKSTMASGKYSIRWTY